MKNSSGTSDYALLDSGDGFKVERLSSHIIKRPSSWCIWHSHNQDVATSTFDPKNNSWSKDLAPWVVDFSELNVRMEARLQRNGQIGIFPEHATYLARIASDLAAKPGSRVLNLFAFSGLASMVALRNGAHVTHVDILKTALDWTTRNAELNEFSLSSLRLIPDEALAFLNREVRRGSRYDMIIADPPSFSRISKGKDWELDGVLNDLLDTCLELMNDKGSLYFTCHHGELAGPIVENLIREKTHDTAHLLTSEPLSLAERSRNRKIPAGFLTVFIK